MKYFTLSEANTLLPLVRSIVAGQLALRQQILDLEPELWPVIQAAATNGGSKSASHAADYILRIQDSIAQLYHLGVVVKDINTGLVDFPALFRGREVYLCWQYDEDQVRFWHELDTGFAGRQPINPSEW